MCRPRRRRRVGAATRVRRASPGAPVLMRAPLSVERDVRERPPGRTPFPSSRHPPSPERKGAHWSAGDARGRTQPPGPCLGATRGRAPEKGRPRAGRAVDAGQAGRGGGDACPALDQSSRTWSGRGRGPGGRGRSFAELDESSPLKPLF